MYIYTTIVMESRRVRQQVNTLAKSFIEHTAMRCYHFVVDEMFSDREVNCGRLYVLRLFTDAMVRGYPLYGNAIRCEYELLKTSLVCQCKSWWWPRMLNTIKSMFTLNTPIERGLELIITMTSNRDGRIFRDDHD